MDKLYIVFLNKCFLKKVFSKALSAYLMILMTVAILT
ncbi:Uncharacterised protein [Limosilactobacillus oris]|nr:Uncharacterised protein [Limosilactobacillus oris]